MISRGLGQSCYAINALSIHLVVTADIEKEDFFFRYFYCYDDPVGIGEAYR